MYTETFERALNHAMLYEVGKFWKLTPSVELGLIGTREQRRAVGYVNDPVDAGGETKYGIAKSGNPGVDITNLDWPQAKQIYFEKYWLAGRCDKMPEKVAILHFDGCVNHGVTNAAKFLQRAVGVVDDGVIGPVTLSELQISDIDEICDSICKQRAEFYYAIVARRPNQSRFINGWLARINEVSDYIKNL